LKQETGRHSFQFIAAIQNNFFAVFQKLIEEFNRFIIEQFSNWDINCIRCMPLRKQF